MLARITTATAHLVDVCFESSGLSTQEDEDGESSLVVNLQALRGLLSSTPDNLWGRVAACGRAVAPLCSNLQRALSSDFDNVTQLLLYLEVRHEESFHDLLPVGLLNDEELGSNSTQVEISSKMPCHRPNMTERPPRKRWRSSQAALPIIIPSTHPSTPSIIVTPAPSRPRESSCCVPYQNQAFGNLLSVPTHPVFNESHPPLSLNFSLLPCLDKREWKNGHWEIILPSLEEQNRRGMFSRAIPPKRKSCRLSVRSGRQDRRCR